MRNQTLKVLFLTLYLIVSVVSNLYAMCVESGEGGHFGQSGFRQFAEELITSTKEYGKGIELFIEQNQKGDYGKICNEDIQKIHFKKTRNIEGVIPTCSNECINISSLTNKYYGKNSICKYEYMNNCFRVCCY